MLSFTVTVCCVAQERPGSVIHPCYGGLIPGMDMLRRPSPLTHPALTHKSLSKVSVRQARPAGLWPPPLFTYELLQINQKLLCNNFHPLPSVLIYFPSSSSLSGRISFFHHERLKSVCNFFSRLSLFPCRSQLDIVAFLKTKLYLCLYVIIAVMIISSFTVCWMDKNTEGI